SRAPVEWQGVGVTTLFSSSTVAESADSVGRPTPGSARKEYEHMNLLYTVVIVLIAATFGTRAALAAEKVPSGGAIPALKKWAEECEDCAKCGKTDGRPECSRMCSTCQHMCLVCAELMTGKSDLAQDACVLCEKVCSKCAAECAKYNAGCCKECAKVCKE